MSDKYFYELRSEIEASGRLYEDPYFQPSDQLLIKGDKKRVDEGSLQVKWMRPKEFTSEAKFIAEGMTRFDVIQGNAGDCWFLAAAASLATNKRLMQRVVPQDQSFTQNYSGVFRFVFWRYDRFEQVIIDDRLPVGVDGNSNYLLYTKEGHDKDFWMPLLEKAYAKLNGGYHTIVGGWADDGLSDLTGGITENVDSSEVPADFFYTLYDCSRMNSLIGLSCRGDKELKRKMGLVYGHAYSITAVKRVKSISGEEVQLVRVRNPWGSHEWNGAWSDSSTEWGSLSDEVKSSMQKKEKEDGEFWVAYQDMVKYFETIRFCHLYPDALTKEISKDNNKDNWECLKLHGELRHADASPSNKGANQLKLYLEESDDKNKDGECTVVISLLVKDWRKKWRLEGVDVRIRYAVYKSESEVGPTVDVEVGPIWNQAHAEEVAANYLRSHPGTKWTGHWRTTKMGVMSVIQIQQTKASTTRKLTKAHPGNTAVNSDLTEHITLPPGNYVIEPQLLTSEVDKAGFLLRAFTKKLN